MHRLRRSVKSRGPGYTPTPCANNMFIPYARVSGAKPGPEANAIFPMRNARAVGSFSFSRSRTRAFSAPRRGYSRLGIFGVPYRCFFSLFISLFLDISPSLSIFLFESPIRSTGAILIVILIRALQPGNRGRAVSRLFVSFNRILVSRYAHRCISSSLRYRRPIPVIYISVIIGKVSLSLPLSFSLILTPSARAR